MPEGGDSEDGAGRVVDFLRGASAEPTRRPARRSRSGTEQGSVTRFGDVPGQPPTRCRRDFVSIEHLRHRPWPQVGYPSSGGGGSSWDPGGREQPAIFRRAPSSISISAWRERLGG